MTKHGLPIKERIQSSIVIDDNGCWIWKRFRDKKGYGLVSVSHKTFRAHRVSFEAHVRPIPEGFHIDHLCRVTSCVNPEHLEPVTQAENNRRQGMAVTHCPQGHEYTEQNIYWEKPKKTGFNSAKRCKVCKLARGRRHYYSSKLLPKDSTTISS
jgi:hypothetical protein